MTPARSEDGGGKYGSYKRASRAGALRRFPCDFPGCDKAYSRAEHLHRHQLNHNPREMYYCDITGCGQEFVRADLLARHQKRHTASYVPRSRVSNLVHSRELENQNTEVSSVNEIRPEPSFSAGPASAQLKDADALSKPEDNATPTPLSTSMPSHPRMDQTSTPTWIPQTAGDPNMASVPVQPNAYADAITLTSTQPFPNMANPFDEHLAQENFATWLFDPQTNYDPGLSTIPFLETGLESAFNNNIQYDYESLTSQSQMGFTPPNRFETLDELGEARHQEISEWCQVFRQKRQGHQGLAPDIVYESGGNPPVLSIEMLRVCLEEFWEDVSPRLPIVHRHTFSPNRAPTMLVLLMVALGAASRRNRDSTGTFKDYGAFADLVVASVRWEVLTSDDAQPPISLWVAQALLLLEFYEKLYSSRKFHERAHIYHSSFLTLLRRGSPLIGRAGDTSGSGDEGDDETQQRPESLDSRTWWLRWAQTESMHRVVFGAFMLDIIHAAMFGHSADMAAHEIRLPLPCDDNLWTASSPDLVRQLDANFRMYGVEQVTFLDGLKNALHGKEVKTHSFGRMIVMSGLLSVGWHLNHRETHLRWLETRLPSFETRIRWREMFLGAFDNWKTSFDRAMRDPSSNSLSGANGPISSATALYHLANISLHTNIVDLQVYAGAKRLLGRKISSRDYSNAVRRMITWAKLASTRHAILHAFRLLHSVLVIPKSKRRDESQQHETYSLAYSVRTETDPHRPWIMYYCVLSIWSFVGAFRRAREHHTPVKAGYNIYYRMAEYLSNIAALEALDEETSSTLHDGLLELIQVMRTIFGEAKSDLLLEARERLGVCETILMGSAR